MSITATVFKPQPSQAATVGLFLFTGVLAALWLTVNLVYPGLAATGIPTVVTRLAIHAATLAVLWLGLARTGFSLNRRVLIWLGVAIPFTLWLAVVWNLARAGVFVPKATGLPMLPIAIFAPVVVGLFVLLRSKTIGTLLDAMPAHWLVALQVYRIFGGVFIVNWVQGAAPGIFAWPAGTGDTLTGMMALPVALLLASGAEKSRNAAIAWNTFGLLDFAVAITLGMLSTAGPLQIFGLDIPASLLAGYPTVMTPAFTVPSSILLHALSIRQLRRIAQRSQSAGEPQFKPA